MQGTKVSESIFSCVEFNGSVAERCQMIAFIIRQLKLFCFSKQHAFPFYLIWCEVLVGF